MLDYRINFANLLLIVTRVSHCGRLTNPAGTRCRIKALNIGEFQNMRALQRGDRTANQYRDHRFNGPTDGSSSPPSDVAGTADSLFYFGIERNSSSNVIGCRLRPRMRTWWVCRVGAGMAMTARRTRKSLKKYYKESEIKAVRKPAAGCAEFTDLRHPRPKPLELSTSVALVGPTAASPNSALILPSVLPAEIVSYDSVRVFRYMDIGTCDLRLKNAGAFHII
jgi:hypothetical protein